jgi:hypothetical protein
MKEVPMNLIKNISVIKLISILVVIFMLINLAYAGDEQVWNYKEKKVKKLSDWSLSFYLAAAFGGQIVRPGTRMRSPGVQDHYNFSTEYMIYSITTFEPRSWMIQLDYRMMKHVGMGILFGNSVLAKGATKIGPLAGSGGIIEIGSSVRTLSLFLTIYVNDYIVLGFGPTYSMTDAPSNKNRFGFLAQMTVRIPLDERFSVNGIIQYRYVGITEIGPYTLYSADEYPTATVTTPNYIYPETQINYSHLFVGLGMSLYFAQK